MLNVVIPRVWTKRQARTAVQRVLSREVEALRAMLQIASCPGTGMYKQAFAFLVEMTRARTSSAIVSRRRPSGREYGAIRRELLTQCLKARSVLKT